MMKVKMILPALTEAQGPYWRSIKYSLFPPLGLATLAGYLDDDDDISIQDEHVEDLDLDDEPDLVVIEAYITSAYRSYEIADYYRARGTWVVMGGIHVTSLPDEAIEHADTVCIGPGEDIWPEFLVDFRAGRAKQFYRSTTRTLIGQPAPRRDLIKRSLYLVPNSLVVSRGCPHHCDFCYKDSFFRGGKSFYVQIVDEALAQIERMPGKHLYFLDDNIFADSSFARALFDGMRGMGRVWQAAGTVQAAFDPGLLESAVESGLRSLFIGFETLNTANLKSQSKYQNLDRDYNTVIKRLHSLGVMVNASFVFGMDNDDRHTPARTVEWAVKQGIETATFHILTPYPGTALYDRMLRDGRIITSNWDLYDTRHVVYRPLGMDPVELEQGYWQAYAEFYKWSSIIDAAWTKDSWLQRIRHLVYTGGWKKSEAFWKCIVQARKVSAFVPALEAVLTGQGARRNIETEPQIKTVESI